MTADRPPCSVHGSSTVTRAFGSLPLVTPPEPAQPSPPAPAQGALLRVTRSCAIPLSELEWRYSAAGGPGGQHANRANTRVEVRFDVASSPSLGPRQQARLVERLGPTIRVVAAEQRSQAQNRSVALDRLRDRLALGLHVERPRRPTAPTRGSKERRLTAKRRQSERKRDRQGDPDDS